MILSIHVYRHRFQIAHPDSQVTIERYTRFRDPVYLHCPIHGEVKASSAANLLWAAHACPKCGEEASQSPSYPLPEKHKASRRFSDTVLQRRMAQSPTPDCRDVQRDPADPLFALFICPRHGQQKVRIGGLICGCILCRKDRNREKREAKLQK
ncbi:DUF723 domain-containing protein [Formivibrio citricus]|uniref:DUF723 domain-containing protein n=1 Tax=Formivibrio citricus TaxID=83765 RepID=UPI000B86E048|nr:DUF723 domain-containing protein [Formivibrio citricus]